MKNVTKVMHAHKTLVAIVGGVAAVVLIIAAVAIYHSVAPSRLPGLGEYETFAHEFEGAGPFSPNYKVTLEIPGPFEVIDKSWELQLLSGTTTRFRSVKDAAVKVSYAEYGRYVPLKAAVPRAEDFDTTSTYCQGLILDGGGYKKSGARAEVVDSRDVTINGKAAHRMDIRCSIDDNVYDLSTERTVRTTVTLYETMVTVTVGQDSRYIHAHIIYPAGHPMANERDRMIESLRVERIEHKEEA